MTKKLIVMLVSLLLIPVVAGCGTTKKARRIDELEIENRDLKFQIAELKKEYNIKIKNLIETRDLDAEALKEEKAQELARLKDEFDFRLKDIASEKDEELQRLLDAKRELETTLKKELAEYKAKLSLNERGLVITLLEDILFDSGKAEIKEEAVSVLDTVAAVINKQLRNSPVAVEGHTDNEPIKYSGWKSNWELSAHRALSVVHYFIDKRGVGQGRLSAVGYGEYRPVATNETPEGRQQNRRVEIVILPESVKRVKAQVF